VSGSGSFILSSYGWSASRSIPRLIVVYLINHVASLISAARSRFFRLTRNANLLLTYIYHRWWERVGDVHPIALPIIDFLRQPISGRRWFHGLIADSIGFLYFWIRGMSVECGTHSRKKTSAGSSRNVTPIGNLILIYWKWGLRVDTGCEHEMGRMEILRVDVTDSLGEQERTLISRHRSCRRILKSRKVLQELNYLFARGNINIFVDWSFITERSR